jgi:hypothetical protein
MIEIYPQLVVGGVQTISKDTWALYYPTLLEICGRSSLLTDLQALRTKGTPLEGLKDAARNAIASRALVIDGRQLVRDYPEIERIAVLLDAGRLDEAVTAIEEYGDPPEKSIQLGESMLANLVLNENQLVVETAHRFLKVIWVINILSKSGMIKLPSQDREPSAKRPSDQEGGSYTDFIKRFWTVGAVSIPLDIPAPQHGAWPTQGYLEQEMEKPAPSNRPDIQSLLNELKTLQATKADLEQQYQAQLTKQKAAKLSKEEFISQRAREDETAARTAPAVPARPAAPIDWNKEFEKYAAAINPSLLTDESYLRLSAATRAALATIGFEGRNIDVPSALGAIDSRMAALHSIADHPRASVPAVQFGNFIVEANPSVLAEIICGEPKPQCHCELLKQLARKHGEKPQVRILGLGRAYRVRQELKRYVRAELVHTESVLGQTKRSASFRDLNRVEEVQEIITSRETFEEKETTTHDQFEFAAEVAKQTEQDHQEQAGVSVTASYGTVSMSGSYSTSSATASSDAAHTATNSAKEVINKAVSRIQEKVQERRSVTRITETERQNHFEIDNEGNASFTGFYYAINKEYENQLIEVGERLMIRVAIQQPMAFLLHCMATMQPETAMLEKPIPPAQLNDPRLGNLNSFQDITGTNYAIWGSLYNAQGIKPPPANIVVSHAVSRDWPSNQWVATAISIDVPVGYEAISALVTCLYSPGSGRYIDAFLGHAYFSQNGGSLVLDREQGKIYGTIRGHVEEYAINYVMTCAPTTAEMNKWRIDVYNAVMEGYNKKKAEYDGQVSVAGIAVEGRNPLKNRMLIEQELQKFVLGAVYPPFYYRGFDSMKFGYKCDDKGVPEVGSLPIPEPDFKDANEELPWVTFFLQLFEWKNMTYKFLPYHFGNRRDWCVLRRLEDVDQFFENAITSGYVVVDIPVAAQMTNAFLHFYQTQQIWNGGDMPLYGDPMFQEIAIAIKEAENLGDGEEAGKPWTTVVPTPLVYVQDGVPADL